MHALTFQNKSCKPSPSFGQEEAEIIFKQYGSNKVDILENFRKEGAPTKKCTKETFQQKQEDITSLQQKKMFETRWIKKDLMTPFYGWGLTASRLQSLQGGCLLLTTKVPEIPGTHF